MIASPKYYPESGLPQRAIDEKDRRTTVWFFDLQIVKFDLHKLLKRGCLEPSTGIFQSRFARF
jgi:hypothetical protein